MEKPVKKRAKRARKGVGVSFLDRVLSIAIHCETIGAHFGKEQAEVRGYREIVELARSQPAANTAKRKRVDEAVKADIEEALAELEEA